MRSGLMQVMRHRAARVQAVDAGEWPVDPEMAMELECLGATGTETGSKNLVSSHGKRLLVDCGLRQASGSLEYAMSDPASHGHIISLERFR